MPTADLELKKSIEKKIREEDFGLERAKKLLGVSSIDKEYLALLERTSTTQFQFEAERPRSSLRNYQISTLESLDQLLKARLSAVGVQLPTGAGKTFLIHSYIYGEYLKQGKNVLVVTPSWEIANQHAITVCQQFKDGQSRVRRLGGEGQLMEQFPEYKPQMKGKVLLTTSALFYARQKKLRETLKCDLVVIDEGHYGWKKKRLNSISSFARERGAQVVFLTATPPLNMSIMPFAAQLKYLDLVPEYLVPCEVVRIETGESFAPVIKNGLLTQKSRVELSSRTQRYQTIVAESIKQMKGQTIYFAGSVDEAMGVVEEFGKHQISATVVHSKWAKKGARINALAIEKFRQGEVQVLVNVQMLAMGFDVPNVETIIVARPVESDTLFTQMVGRGARPASGKEKFILIDVHDIISKPEVAKIFEHDGIFYGQTKEEVLPPVETKKSAKLFLLPRTTQKEDLPFPYENCALDLRLPNIAADFLAAGARGPFAISA